MNKILWSKKSLKQLLKIQQQTAIKIKKEAERLIDFPHCNNIRTLTNHQYSYRLRVGQFRVFFDFDNSGTVNIISIKEVKKRDERTY